MRKARTIYLLVAFALVGVLLYQQKNSVYSLVSSEERKILIEESESDDHALTPSMPVIISDARIQHILYGDKKGVVINSGLESPANPNSLKIGMMKKLFLWLVKLPRMITCPGNRNATDIM